MTTQEVDRRLLILNESKISRGIARWVLPLGLALLAFALYIATRSDVHTLDALTYIRNVDQRAELFFHPNHLLYSPTGWLFWQSWRLLGYRGNSEIPLQALNSLAAAACGFGFYRVVLQVTRKWSAALVAAGLLLFNYAAWYFAVEVEVYMLALIWLVWCLALLVEAVQRPRRRTAPLLGFALGMAALYHQTNVLLVPVVAAALGLSSSSWRVRISRLLQTAAIAGAIVGLGYGLIAFGYNGYRSYRQFHDWMFFLADTGLWGRSSRGRLADLLSGLSNSISTEGAWAFWLAIGVLLLLGLPAAVRRWPRLVLLCGMWLGLYGAFFTWWEGENIEFWIATFLPLWFLVGLSVARLPDGWKRMGSATTQRFPLGVVACALPVLLAWHNYPIIYLRGDARQDLQRQVADRVKSVSSRDDLIVSSGGVLEIYMTFYEDRRNVRTVNGAISETGGDIPAALARLREAIDTSVRAGLAVLVDREALKPIPDRNGLRYPITQAQLDAFWGPYRAAFEPAVNYNGITYFWRIPSATAAARQGGWKWQTFDWGWQATNIAAPRFTGSWCFNPKPDPIFMSPLMNVEATPFHTLEVTMRSTAAGQRGQLFYAGPDGAMSDERSVRWTIEGDGATHTYRVPLAGSAGWQGTITRMRLDPIEAGDGTPASETCIESLRLLP